MAERKPISQNAEEKTMIYVINSTMKPWSSQYSLGFVSLKWKWRSSRYLKFSSHLLLSPLLRRQIFAEDEREWGSEGTFERMTDAQTTRQPRAFRPHFRSSGGQSALFRHGRHSWDNSIIFIVFHSRLSTSRKILVSHCRVIITLKRKQKMEQSPNSNKCVSYLIELHKTQDIFLNL